MEQNIDQNEIHILTRKMDELIWSEVYHDTIRGSRWLSPDLAFSPGRGAIGYQMMYVLYRVLDEFCPESILELGMGQSTKMIGSYAAYKKEKTKHYVVEHDEEWIKFFSNNFQLPVSTEIIRMDIEDISVEMGEGKDRHYTNVTQYAKFASRLNGKKFDFILIDGPYGYRSPEYSRIDILDILPVCLKENFVILMDDCDREGERQTCELIKLMLDDAGIQYYYRMYSGEKDVMMITSESLKFLCLM